MFFVICYLTFFCNFFCLLSVSLYLLFVICCYLFFLFHYHLLVFLFVSCHLLFVIFLFAILFLIIYFGCCHSQTDFFGVEFACCWNELFFQNDLSLDIWGFFSNICYLWFFLFAICCSFFAFFYFLALILGVFTAKLTFFLVLYAICCVL